MGVKKWMGLRKTAEECGELVVELMKLEEFPSGKHPGRKRSLILSTEDELADVLAACDYFIERNGLDRKRIEKRRLSKIRKFSKWWGENDPVRALLKRSKPVKVVKTTKRKK